jgi:hypothetical protein
MHGENIGTLPIIEEELVNEILNLGVYENGKSTIVYNNTEYVVSSNFQAIVSKRGKIQQFVRELAKESIYDSFNFSIPKEFVK